MLVTTEVDGAVATVTLNRADKSNALNVSVVAALSGVLGELDANDAVRVVVLTGAGKHFCAGADIDELAGRTSEDMYFTDPVQTGREDVSTFRKPIIAAINGLAIGGGFEIALMCDMIVASEGAKFGCPEVKLGTLPGAGATQRLTRAIGYYQAAPIILSGDLIDAKCANELGIVSVLTKEDARIDAQSCAIRMAQNPLHALMLCKEAMRQSLEMPLSQGLRFEKRLFHGSVGSSALSAGLRQWMS